MFQTIFLQGTGGGLFGGSLFFPLMMLAIVFVFFILLPQRQRKSEEALANSLKEGMEVYTRAGIIGKIVKIEGNSVRLMIDDKVFIRVLKQTIAGEFKA